MRHDTEIHDKKYYARKAIKYGLLPRNVDVDGLKKKTVKRSVESYRARLGKGKTYSMMSVKELRYAIKKLNLKNFHKLDKPELVLKLKQHKILTGRSATQTCRELYSTGRT